MATQNSIDNRITNNSFSVDAGGTERFSVSTGGVVKFNNAYTFPAIDGTGDYVLKTNGAGAISWGILTVPGGGTGLATITDHALIVGSGAAAVTEIGPLTNGQLPIGSTGADPVASTLTAGSGISIVNAAGSITISSPFTGLSWSEVGADGTLVVNTGILSTVAGGATLTMALPATATQGDIIYVAAKTNSYYKITQAANQQIINGALASTLGITGYLECNTFRGNVQLLCVTGGASTIWHVLSMVGNNALT